MKSDLVGSHQYISYIWCGWLIPYAGRVCEERGWTGKTRSPFWKCTAAALDVWSPCL